MAVMLTVDSDNSSYNCNEFIIRLICSLKKLHINDNRNDIITECTHAMEHLNGHNALCRRLGEEADMILLLSSIQYLPNVPLMIWECCIQYTNWYDDDDNVNNDSVMVSALETLLARLRVPDEFRSMAASIGDSNSEDDLVVAPSDVIMAYHKEASSVLMLLRAVIMTSICRFNEFAERCRIASMDSVHEQVDIAAEMMLGAAVFRPGCAGYVSNDVAISVGDPCAQVDTIVASWSSDTLSSVALSLQAVICANDDETIVSERSCDWMPRLIRCWRERSDADENVAMTIEASHILNWCVHQVVYPRMDELTISLLVPCLLRILSRVNVGDRIDAARAISHLSKQASPTELRWHGRADAIADALRREIGVRHGTLALELLGGQAAILNIAEPSSSLRSASTYGRWDDAITIILRDVEFENRLSIRGGLLRALFVFINGGMGVRIVRHLGAIVKVLSRMLTVNGGLGVRDPHSYFQLIALESLIRQAWPRSPTYAVNIVEAIAVIYVRECRHWKIDSSDDDLNIHQLILRSCERCAILVEKCCFHSAIPTGKGKYIQEIWQAMMTSSDDALKDLATFVQENIKETET